MQVLYVESNASVNYYIAYWIVVNNEMWLDIVAVVVIWTHLNFCIT
jgi:hypothetical protein